MRPFPALIPLRLLKLHALYEVALFHHFRHLGHEAGRY
jgi:hypothetical protein